MRVAALYDIHGNLPALEAVLADICRSGVDRVVVGGDVLPGPMPRECLTCLRALGARVDCIRGNGESAVLAHLAGAGLEALPEAARQAVRWAAEHLAAEELRRIAGWPATVRLRIPGHGGVLFCHATPRSDTEIFTRVTPEESLLPVFRGAGAALVVCGHTHMPFDRMIGATRVVNAGSVGMPFGDPVASWLLLGPDVELRRTPYDLHEAAARICATPYPQAEEFARRNVLDPPAEAEMLAFYSRIEIPLRTPSAPPGSSTSRR
jgi:predicted phosphodiesterase